jgi:ferrous iron transport protein A
MNSKQSMPLSMVKSGEKVRLVCVNAGQGLKNRLTEMGLVPDVEITVVNNEYFGPCVIDVMGSKMVLGRGMAHKIMVA